ncbi:MAG: YSC84-related protein, partial [Gammaproteobacteria bacterium]|nr:YSC84-related protein [Gammaproteobacteria bacterium]
MQLTLRSSALLVCTILISGVTSAAEPSKEQRRADARKTAAQTLARLYEAQPRAKKAIEEAAGYAVFSNVGVKIFITGGGRGAGIAVDNSTGKETFMKMVEVQAGLGIGVKKFRVVFVFENHAVLNEFTESGWQLGAQATAAAKGSGEEGEAFAGAMSMSPGVWLYQLTDAGLALEFTG